MVFPPPELPDCEPLRKRKTTSTCPRRVKRIGDIIFMGLCIVASLGLINSSRTAIADASASKVQVETLEFSQFPIPGSHYESTEGTSFDIVPGKLEMPNLKMRSRRSSPGTPLPDPGEAVSAPAVVDIFLSAKSLTVGEWDNVEIYDFTAGVGVSNAPPADVLAFTSSSPPPAGSWALELENFAVSALLTGIGEPVPFVLRESPTLASLGQHILTRLPDGGLHINSFFDVFFELSYDGGPFVPADNPVRLDITAIVPEPMAVALVGTAVAMLSLSRRRSAAGCADAH